MNCSLVQAPFILKSSGLSNGGATGEMGRGEGDVGAVRYRRRQLPSKSLSFVHRSELNDRADS